MTRLLVALLLTLLAVVPASAGTITITKPVTIAGAGMGSTTLSSGATTGVVFNVTTTGAVTFRDLAIVHSGTTTAGATIRIDPGGASNNGGSRFERVLLQGCWVCLDSVRASEWVFHASRVDNPRSIGINIQNLAVSDYGENTIANSLFSATGTSPSAHVALQSGGGLRIVGNKFLQSGTPILINSSVTTSVLTITGNSLENFTVSGITLQTQGAGRFENFAITGNEIRSVDAGVPHIHINSANVARGAITGNVIALDQASAEGIRITTGEQIQIGENAIGGNLAAGQIGIRVLGGTFINIGPNVINGVASPIVGTSNTFLAAMRLSFAQLPTAGAGSLVLCTDCATGSPCVGGSDGRLANRRSGSWVC